MKQLFSSILKRQKIIFLGVLFLSSIIFIAPTVVRADSVSDAALQNISNVIQGNNLVPDQNGNLVNPNNVITSPNVVNSAGGNGTGVSNLSNPSVAAQTASAGGWQCTNFSTNIKTTGVGLLNFGQISNSTLSGCLDAFPPEMSGDLAVANGGALSGVGVGITRQVLRGTYLLAAYSSYLLDYTLSTIMQATITKKDATTGIDFTPAWAEIRDFANMVIVLGFVVVGIATALRIREYEAKQLLGKLIIVALIVNFSGLFCGLIIDASNLLVKGMGGGGSNMGEVMVYDVMHATNTGLGPQLAATPASFAGFCLLFSIVYLGIAFTFIYMAAIITARYTVLIMLFILSPLAFSFWVYPATKKWWTEWWSTFLKWAFVGVFASFVIFLTSIIFKQMPGLNQTVSTPNRAVMFISCVIVLMFLYVGFKMTSKSTGVAAIAGNAMIGMAKGAAGFAVGAAVMGTKGGAGAIDKLTGGRASSAAQRLSAGTGRMMENLGLRAKGSTAQTTQGQLKEPEGRMTALVNEGNLSEVQRTAKGEGMVRNPRERAGAISALLKSGNFDINDTKQVEGLTYFQNQGGDLSEYSKKDPRLAQHDISATRETMQKRGIYAPEAKQLNIDSAYSKLGVRGMRDLPASAMNMDFIRNVKPAANNKAAEEYSAEQVAQLKKFADPSTPEHAEHRRLTTSLYASGDPAKMDEADRIVENVRNINSW